jgi:hydrogenase maturation protease
MAESVVVIGYGSTLRRDDAVGRLAAEAVDGWRVPGVTVFSVTQLTPELARPLASARLAIFLDARPVSGGRDEPVTSEARPLKTTGGRATVGHAGDPERLLGLAELAYGSCPDAWLVAIPALDFGLGEGLSPTAERGLADALRRVAELISSALPVALGEAGRIE